MDVIIKDWGVQVWHDQDVLMVMRKGTKTSMHKHNLYDTYLKCVSGECFVEAPSGGNMSRGRTLFIPAGVWHQISATTDCVIEEEYLPKRRTRTEPVDDIERMSHTDKNGRLIALAELTALGQELGLYDDNTKNPLIKE